MTAQPTDAATGGSRRIALLIDADNVGTGVVDRVVEAAAKHGRVTVRRAYRLWTDRQYGTWKTVLDRHAIMPVQVESGPNAADMAIAIDAMDLMHAGRIDGVCIVSSDGDFARLAQRMREQGLFVMAAGANLSGRLRAACDDAVSISLPAKPEPPPAPKPRVAVAKDFEKAVHDAFAAVKRDRQSWARVTDLGKRVPAGVQPPGKFTTGLKALEAFEVAKRQFDGVGAVIDCVRLKDGKKGP